ncbi:PREDICTED: exopolygalacturonase [Theobroma cacao]|uniref:Polygalacturonase n=1 Tax=Theobroma cacao TaxID=3641 RepID=A0AB32X2S9_THECC|nr:PREDICTED: exopolygalacturonase [Theobroma cacao]
MAVELTVLALSLFFLLASNAKAQSNNVVFDVMNFGAKADGKTDISQALMAAWRKACAVVSPSKVVIPEGEYILSQVTLAGPCKAPLEVQVRGTLKATADPSKFNNVPTWVTFQRIDRFTLSGAGTFDGQGGKAAWAQNDCKQVGRCNKLPINLRFNAVSNGLVRDITSVDSKQTHINLLSCKNLTFANITVNAPAQSPNTDGIHIGRSSGINITDSRISTGDDCVSLGEGSQKITVRRVTCGPGHGISVGSLGRYREDPVFGITVANCTLINTSNGVRVKTWPASLEGIASDMHFEDIVMVNVSNPVLIDQEYCPGNKCAKAPSRVKISNVSFKNIRGTSATQVAVELTCSSGIPCENVEIGDINLSYIGTEGPATSRCSNVKPIITGKQTPLACGLAV